MLKPETIEALGRIYRSGATRFTELAELAGLDSAVDFQDAEFISLSFRGEILRGYNFSNNDFLGADFQAADLSATIGLDTAVLTGSLSDAATRWPPNLHPVGTLAYIPPGTFTMGTPPAEARREKLGDAKQWASLTRGLHTGFRNFLGH